MSRPSLLILLGVLIILAPFSGLPNSWLSFIIPLFGFGVCIIGFSLRLARVRESIKQHQPEHVPHVEAEEVDAPRIPPHGVSPI